VVKLTAMRILHLYKAYPPIKGGIENTVELLAESQVAAGHDVTVLVSAKGWWPQVEILGGVRVVREPRLLELASTPLSPTLPLRLLFGRPDIAHVHSPFPPAEVANLLFGRARRTVLTYHSDVVRQRHIMRLYAPVLHAVLRRVDRIFPTSAPYMQRSPFLREAADRCQVIPLGIRLEPFARPDATAAARLRLRWSSDGQLSARPVVLFVGRLRAYKGLAHLLHAMTRVEANLAIVGDGPERRRLEALSRRLGIAHRVHFSGHLADELLPAAYQAADLFVLPSHLPSEAFGLVMVEAMASGLPVVCTELGTGTSVVVQDGETGLVVPPADPDALAQACNRLLSDDGLRQQLGRAGRHRARTEFSAETYVSRTQDAYEDVLR
jgi:glycosyltransferase involved in cell wall biosynthesis